MTYISLKGLTDRQLEAWRMRYAYRWRLTRIALKMGISPPAVVKLLKRAEARAGLVRRGRTKVIRTKPRDALMVSLSTAYNY